MKRAFTACAVVLLGVCLETSLVAQAIAPRKFRAVAGEARTAVLRDGVPPMAAIESTRTTPPLEFPIRVLPTAAPESPGLKLVIPPATPPGDYTVEVAGRGPDGRNISTTLQVTVDAVTLSPAAVAARPPVILLNGFQLTCSDTASTLTASVDTFGQLASLLQSDGVGVAYFNNCTYGAISIEQLAAQLNNYLAMLHYTDGTPISQVDLVVHSMGGLIARAYLAGKGQSSGAFSPPVNHKVRKLIAIATPHFGSFQAGNGGTQLPEMALGSQFLWDLATWNQGQDDLRGVDALAIIGNAGTYGNTSNASDGVVSLTSASLGFVEPDQRTRIVPYCHVTPGFLTGLGMSCFNNQGIANIDSASHLSAQIVRSFLADTTAWQSLGNPPSTDPFLWQYGGALLALKGTNDLYFTDLTSVSFDTGTGSLEAGPRNTIASVYYSEFIPGGQHAFSMTHSSGQVTTGAGTPVAGSTRALLFKFGPVIGGVLSAVGGLPGLTVASGSNITVYGGGFSGAGTQLTANGAPLSISSLSDQQITAFLPGRYNGLVQLKVTNANGQHTVNIMTAAAAPPPSILLSASQASFSYTLGGALPGSQTINVTNNGGGTLAWSAASGAFWLTVSPNSGVGSGTLTLGINPAGLNAQTYNGAITVMGSGALNSPRTISVVLTVKSVTCTYALSTGGQAFTAQGGTVATTITTAPGCPWTVSNLPTWVTLTSVGSGTGTGTLTFSVQQNTGAARAAAITVAGQTFTISQDTASTAGLSFAGSMAQIAWAGGWETSLTLVNLGSTHGEGRLNLYASDPTLPWLSVTPPQPPWQGTVFGATFDASLNANAMVVLDTTGPASLASAVGSAQLLTSGSIDGFAVFQIESSGQQAVVPLETRNASAYLLAFDHTNGLKTGFALANVSATADNVKVVVRDDTGAVIPTKIASISLSGNGHASFMLDDPTQGFPEIEGKRGTVEFDTPSGGQISVLGLRANGKAITTLPVLAQVGTTGGALAQVATGGGWETGFTLVNAGTTTASFTLNFYDEKTGVLLPLPLVFSQTGVTQTTASVTQALPPGATLLIQTQGGNASVSCSAQLTTTGQVSGFAIFQILSTGQEAVVPLETRTPNAFVLAYDNTNGLATGLALANFSPQLASVLVLVRDDTGATITQREIQLAGKGHTQFMLTDAVQGFPATASKRGTIEFQTPSGGRISALGIRAVTATNVITTIPVLAK